MRSRKPVTFSRRRFLERCLAASAGIGMTPSLAWPRRKSAVDPDHREGRYGFPLGEQQDVQLCKVDAVWFG
jgi:hypothetical protein